MSEIAQDYLKAVCKMGEGALCCRYIVAGTDGITCAKLDRSLKKAIDLRVEAGLFTARGDNCPGWGR